VDDVVAKARSAPEGLRRVSTVTSVPGSLLYKPPDCFPWSQTAVLFCLIVAFAGDGG
jgi:hypothetical protein